MAIDPVYQVVVAESKAATKDREAGLLAIIDRCLLKERGHLTAKNEKQGREN